MEFTMLVFFVIAAVVLLRFFSAGKIHKVPVADGLPTSRKVCKSANNSAKNAKRDRRRRNKKRMTPSVEPVPQDFTAAIDRPIKTGQTAKVSQKASLLPLDARDMIVETSCASELAKSPLIEVAISAENDGRTTTLRYIARSDIPRITGKGGRIVKLLEKRFGVKIDVPQGGNGNIVISGSNETTRLAVEANIRDRLIMTVTLPSVDAAIRVAIQKLVSEGKLSILNKSFEGDSVTITGLARDCKAILELPKFH